MAMQGVTIGDSKHIVCLGGGVGTVNLLRGLKKYTTNITTVISMADDGGSAGRLRRLYNILPPGDLVSCMAAMTNGKGFTEQLLRYRFIGERYGKDNELGGHKLGNLIMVALKDLTGGYEEAIEYFKKIFAVKGTFLPATHEHVTISAKTIEGKEIHGEEKIDLGKYKGKRMIEQVILHPADANAAKGVVEGITHADGIVLGPGDLYTNLLPVLIVKEIAEAVKKAKGKKIFIINVANKPFETRGYKVQDYISAIERHIGEFPFTDIIVNNNFDTPIPKKYSYTYVQYKKEQLPQQIHLIEENLVKKDFPLYHDSTKLAKTVWQHI